MKGGFALWGCLALVACATGPEGTAPPPAAPQSLVGTRWVGVTADDVDPRQRPRLEFVSAERVAGYTGCNMLSGTWSMQGGEAKLGPLVTTKRACIGPGAEIERRVVSALAGSMRREGERLVFVAPDGARYEFIPAQAS